MEKDINKAIEYLENYKYDNDVYKAIQILIKGYKEQEKTIRTQANKIKDYEDWIKVGMTPNSEVRKNYISRAELTTFINSELEMIKKNKDKMNETLLGGLEAAYRCMLEVINSKYNN